MTTKKKFNFLSGNTINVKTDGKTNTILLLIATLLFLLVSHFLKVI
jgi:hypothetical protein